MSSKTSSVLLADCDANSRESLVNHLLLSGVKQVGVATDATELIQALRGNDYDIVTLAYTFYKQEKVRNALRQYRKTHTSVMIVLVEDDWRDMTISALKSSDTYMCILRSSASSFLNNIANA